jgi:hypothetical protein
MKQSSSTDILEFLIKSLEKTVKLSGKHRSLVRKYKENSHIINNDIWIMFYFLFILWHSACTLHFTNVQAAGQRWYLLLLVWDKFNDPRVLRTSYMLGFKLYLAFYANLIYSSW